MLKHEFCLNRADNMGIAFAEYRLVFMGFGERSTPLALGNNMLSPINEGVGNNEDDKKVEAVAEESKVKREEVAEEVAKDVDKTKPAVPENTDKATAMAAVKNRRERVRNNFLNRWNSAKEKFRKLKEKFAEEDFGYLDQKMTAENVKKLQQFLKVKGGNIGDFGIDKSGIDGKFGPMTEKALDQVLAKEVGEKAELGKKMEKEKVNEDSMEEITEAANMIAADEKKTPSGSNVAMEYYKKAKENLAATDFDVTKITTKLGKAFDYMGHEFSVNNEGDKFVVSFDQKSDVAEFKLEKDDSGKITGVFFNNKGGNNLSRYFEIGAGENLQNVVKQIFEKIIEGVESETVFKELISISDKGLDNLPIPGNETFSLDELDYDFEKKEITGDIEHAGVFHPDIATFKISKNSDGKWVLNTMYNKYFKEKEIVLNGLDRSSILDGIKTVTSDYLARYNKSESILTESRTLKDSSFSVNTNEKSFSLISVDKALDNSSVNLEFYPYNDSGDLGYQTSDFVPGAPLAATQAMGGVFVGGLPGAAAVFGASEFVSSTVMKNLREEAGSIDVKVIPIADGKFMIVDEDADPNDQSAKIVVDSNLGLQQALQKYLPKLPSFKKKSKN